MAYTGTLFGHRQSTVAQSKKEQANVKTDKLIEIQTAQLRALYQTECLNAKQLQQVLNVGETNTHLWIKSCPAVRTIGRRKVVPIITVSKYLVTGNF